MTTHEQQEMDGSPEEIAEPEARESRSESEGESPVQPAPAPAADSVPPGADVAAAEQPIIKHESSTADTLFADNDVADLRARWAGVQAAFVDNPKDCVQKADHLVSDLVDKLTTGFAEARSRLEEQWSRGQEASTEDLRMALMHYREFFDRLLTV